MSELPSFGIFANTPLKKNFFSFNYNKCFQIFLLVNYPLSCLSVSLNLSVCVCPAPWSFVVTFNFSHAKSQMYFCCMAV